MKKSLCFFFGFFVAVIATYAQPEKGSLFLVPRAGVILSTLKGYANVRVDYQTPDGQTPDGVYNGAAVSGLTKLKAGLSCGVDLEYQSGYHWALSGGVMVDRQGARIKDYVWNTYSMKNARIHLDYIQLPFMVKYYLNNRFSFGAGIQPGYLTSRQVKVNFSGADNYSVSSIAEEFVCFELSAPFSLSYYWTERLYSELRYTYDIFSIINGAGWVPYAPKCRNECLNLTVGYKIKL